MTDLTQEKRAELRRKAEAGARWTAIEKYALLDALDANERGQARHGRMLRGVVAPCLQCGDDLQKCIAQQCCIGCNHAHSKDAELQKPDTNPQPAKSAVPVKEQPRQVLWGSIWSHPKHGEQRVMHRLALAVGYCEMGAKAGCWSIDNLRAEWTWVRDPTPAEVRVAEHREGP